MGIRQRGNKYLVDVSVKGKRKTATCDTEADAILKEAELKAAFMTGVASTPDNGSASKGWTLGYAYKKTYERKWKGSKSERSACLNAKIVMDYFRRDMAVSLITDESIDGFIAFLESKGNSDSTINRKLAALSTILTTCEDSGAIMRKPKIHRRKENAGRMRWLSDTEENTVLNLLLSWDKQDGADAVTVLVDTGMRLSELWATREIDLDFRQGLINCWVNKGDKPRSIPMTARVREVFKRRLEVHGGTPFPYNNAWMRTVWDRVRAHMGLSDDPQFVPHVLRHTCASRLVQRGVGLAVVQAWMGHKDISVTMRYAHLSPVHLLDAVHVLEQPQQTEQQTDAATASNAAVDSSKK